MDAIVRWMSRMAAASDSNVWGVLVEASETVEWVEDDNMVACRAAV